MKRYILILNCLFFFATYGQVRNGKISYKKKQINKEFTKEDKKHLSTLRLKRWSKMEDEIIKVHNKILFNLQFANDKSIFKYEEILNNDDRGYIEIAIGPDGAGVFYNSQKEIVRKLNAFGQEFIIYKSKPKWTITKEKKRIGNYTCFKATLIEKVRASRGDRNHLVTAWFTPQINVPFGPLGYSELPGLILELEARNYKYYAIKINLNLKEKIQITKPTKGKKVTQEEFYNIAIGTMKDLRKRKGF